MQLKISLLAILMAMCICTTLLAQELRIRPNDTTSNHLMVEPIGNFFGAFYGLGAGAKTRDKDICSCANASEAGVYGENIVDDAKGTGIYGKGGLFGVRGENTGTGSAIYYGVFGVANGNNTGANYGVRGLSTSNGGVNYGVNADPNQWLTDHIHVCAINYCCSLQPLMTV